MGLKNYIKIYDNVLPLKTLSNCIRVLNKVKYEEATIINEDKTQGGIINKKIRNTKNFSFAFMKDYSLTISHWHNLLYTVIMNTANRYREDLKLKHLSNLKINDIIGLKYENTGFYTWHADHHENFPRTLSCILLLNNDYEGGSLNFCNPDESEEWSVEVIPNRIIMWPSNFMYPHCVKPVTKGKRFSIVSWLV
jgi:hypothetical protein